MSTQNQDEETRIGLGIVGIIVAALLTTVVGGALLTTCSAKKPAINADAAATIPAAATVAANDDAASIVVENGVVKFFFASGKTEVAGDAAEKLQLVGAQIQEGKKAIVSGYVDSTGSAAANAEISKNRALAVKQALLAHGLAEDHIEMRKPADTNAGVGAQARRVEVHFE